MQLSTDHERISQPIMKIGKRCIASTLTDVSRFRGLLEMVSVWFPDVLR